MNYLDNNEFANEQFLGEEAIGNNKNGKPQQQDQELLIKHKIEILILECNKASMEYLKKGNITEAYDLLRKAEKLLLDKLTVQSDDERLNKLLAITLNNIGCYYRRCDKPNVALKYLKKALEVEVFSLDDKSSVAGTHLNICAIFSSLKKHDLALKHAEVAFDLLQASKDFFILESLSDAKDSKSTDNKQKSLTTTLLIAFYNMGIEQECLKYYSKSIQSFENGYNLALKEIGDDNKLTQTLSECLDRVKNKKEVTTILYFKFNIKQVEKHENDRKTKKFKQMEEGFSNYIYANKRNAGNFLPNLISVDIIGKKQNINQRITTAEQQQQQSYQTPYEQTFYKPKSRAKDQKMLNNTIEYTTNNKLDQMNQTGRFALPQIQRMDMRSITPGPAERRYEDNQQNEVQRDQNPIRLKIEIATNKQETKIEPEDNISIKQQQQQQQQQIKLIPRPVKKIADRPVSKTVPQPTNKTRTQSVQPRAKEIQKYQTISNKEELSQLTDQLRSASRSRRQNGSGTDNNNNNNNNNQVNNTLPKFDFNLDKDDSTQNFKPKDNDYYKNIETYYLEKLQKKNMNSTKENKVIKDIKEDNQIQQSEPNIKIGNHKSTIDKQQENNNNNNNNVNNVNNSNNSNNSKPNSRTNKALIDEIKALSDALEQLSNNNNNNNTREIQSGDSDIFQNMNSSPKNKNTIKLHNNNIINNNNNTVSSDQQNLIKNQSDIPNQSNNTSFQTVMQELDQQTDHNKSAKEDNQNQSYKELYKKSLQDIYGSKNQRLSITRINKMKNDDSIVQMDQSIISDNNINRDVRLIEILEKTKKSNSSLYKPQKDKVLHGLDQFSLDEQIAAIRKSLEKFQSARDSNYENSNSNLNSQQQDSYSREHTKTITKSLTQHNESQDYKSKSEIQESINSINNSKEKSFQENEYKDFLKKQLKKPTNT